MFLKHGCKLYIWDLLEFTIVVLTCLHSVRLLKESTLKLLQDGVHTIHT